MKNLFLSAFALFSFSAFAQQVENGKNYNSTVQSIASQQTDCFIMIIYNCDENGNLITDPMDPRFSMHTVTVRSQNRKELKQSIYCETGIIDNDC